MFLLMKGHRSHDILIKFQYLTAEDGINKTKSFKLEFKDKERKRKSGLFICLIFALMVYL